MTASRLSIRSIEPLHPIGPIHIVATDGILLALDFGHPHDRLLRRLQARFGTGLVFDDSADLDTIAAAVLSYLAGSLDALMSIPLDMGGTPFQRQVWEGLRGIPAGETRSYGQMASGLGKPNAARAVGRANALNPLNIVVPCHRLIGSNGALTGYGGGIDRKRWLLDHERHAQAGQFHKTPCSVSP